MKLEERIKEALSSVPELLNDQGKVNLSEVSKQIERVHKPISRQSILYWLNGSTKKISTDNLKAISKLTGYAFDWLYEEKLPKKYPQNATSSTEYSHNSDIGFMSVNEAGDKDESYEIEYFSSKGSCGGGFMNGDDEKLGKLVKESSWFSHFNVKPHNCKAIYADGDSMSDFIVDGDMVIFDVSKTTPISGKIFLLRYPDGLRIKELYETVSGKWKIRSRNKAFNDEEIAESDDIEIIGQFIYRQGGI